MKFGDFERSLLVSLAAAALVVLFDAQGSISPLFSVSLFAFSMAGHAALQALDKSGASHLDSAYIYVSAIAASFIISSFAFLSFSSVLPLLFLPFCLLAPAFYRLGASFLNIR